MAEHGTPSEQGNNIEGAVAFELAERRYALPIEAVIQIIPMVKLTPLPQAHPALAGIMAFRGRPVPVVELRTYLGLPALPLAIQTPIILIEIQEHTQGRAERRMVGLIVDEVQGVITVNPNHIAPVSATMPESLSNLPLLRGFYQTSEGVILFLDLIQLFLVTPSGATMDRIAGLVSIRGLAASDSKAKLAVAPGLDTLGAG